MWKSRASAGTWLAYLPAIVVIVLPFVVDLSVLAADSGASGAKAAEAKPDWWENLLPIIILLTVISLVLYRLPKVDLGHAPAFIRRRAMNWVPLGLTYAFLYMGRYNLTVYKGVAGMDNDDYSIMFMVGTITYGFSFLLNGPLTDKYGGRATIIVSAFGSAVTNIVMGLMVMDGWKAEYTPVFAVLYAINMYFQSFGAVAIVKVNAPWFHVRERGMIGAVFGILISLGVYFAYDWGGLIVKYLDHAWVFVIPAIILPIFGFLNITMVRDRPSLAGFADFDPGDAQVGEGERLSVWRVFGLMFSQRVIIIISLIEFCSGFLRQSIMQYMYIYAKETGHGKDFVFANWGVVMCCAGILGGIFAGVISDKLFQSRRGPVSAFLYGIMVIGGVITLFTYETSLIGPMVSIMSMAVIGVHGMLSGTASMDFGGRKNTGVAVGIIDGFVYLGTGLMALINAFTLPESKTAAAKEAANWLPLYASMIPVAIIGFLLAMKLWNAKPTRAGGGH